jgi:hypothetical protein
MNQLIHHKYYLNHGIWIIQNKLVHLVNYYNLFSIILIKVENFILILFLFIFPKFPPSKLFFNLNIMFNN